MSWIHVCFCRKISEWRPRSYPNMQQMRHDPAGIWKLITPQCESGKCPWHGRCAQLHRSKYPQNPRCSISTATNMFNYETPFNQMLCVNLIWPSQLLENERYLISSHMTIPQHWIPPSRRSRCESVRGASAGRPGLAKRTGFSLKPMGGSYQHNWVLGGSPHLGYVVSWGGYKPFITRPTLLRGLTNHSYWPLTKWDDPPNTTISQHFQMGPTSSPLADSCR